MSQLDIFAPPSTIDAAFWAYHEHHPEVFEKIITMANKARYSGVQRMSMKMIFEVLRYREMVGGTKVGKLNNNYTSRYVRLLDEQYPELGQLFEHRTIGGRK